MEWWKQGKWSSKYFGDFTVSLSLLHPRLLVVTIYRSYTLEITANVDLNNMESLITVLQILRALGCDDATPWITDVALENGLVVTTQEEPCNSSHDRLLQ
jgi:hypothetical protein